MPTPTYNQDEPGGMKESVSGGMKESLRARLPRAHNNGAGIGEPPSSAPVPTPVYNTSEPLPEPKRIQWRWKFLPAFWTIASVISLTVNVILIIVLLLMYQLLDQLRSLQSYGMNEATGLLGGLYTNFVKMDQATIATNIPVDAMIPLNIVVPVKASTQITLADDVVIPNAHVRINTGGLSINANAVVTLPANTPLMVNLDFPLNVQDTIPVHLDVPVNIPLNQTELHEPFVGLQKVVEPWYCLINPDATVNGLQVCRQTTSPSVAPALTEPPTFEPTPVGTVIP